MDDIDYIMCASLILTVPICLILGFLTLRYADASSALYMLLMGPFFASLIFTCVAVVISLGLHLTSHPEYIPGALLMVFVFIALSRHPRYNR